MLNFCSDRLRTRRTKFGPHENFPLYGILLTDTAVFTTTCNVMFTSNNDTVKNLPCQHQTVGWAVKRSRRLRNKKKMASQVIIIFWLPHITNHKPKITLAITVSHKLNGVSNNTTYTWLSASSSSYLWWCSQALVMKTSAILRVVTGCHELWLGVTIQTQPVSM